MLATARASLPRPSVPLLTPPPHTLPQNILSTMMSPSTLGRGRDARAVASTVLVATYLPLSAHLLSHYFPLSLPKFPTPQLAAVWSWEAYGGSELAVKQTNGRGDQQSHQGERIATHT